MMTIDGIFAQLNGLIERREWDKVEPFLTGCMENASELKNYGIYTVSYTHLDVYKRQKWRKEKWQRFIIRKIVTCLYYRIKQSQ